MEGVAISTETTPKNVFVLGLDELNLQSLHELPHLSRYRFHPLLRVDDLVNPTDLDLPELLERAQRELESFDGRIDAIMGYWDFPVSSMVPILAHRFGLPSPPLESVLKCEHKYWCRLEQQQLIDEHPGFGLVDLAERDPRPPEGLRMPMWLKPVKSFSSDLAYKVHDEREFAEAAQAIRDGIGHIGKAFDDVLGLADLPKEIADIGGQACLAEEAVGGQQVTVEGYSTSEGAHVYGVIDSHNYDGTSSFLRYQYPSKLPEQVQDKLVRVSERLIDGLGLKPSTFNIEYFRDPETDELNVLEVNPRLSQSHDWLFECVDGVPNHLCMTQLALGEQPGLPRGEGEFRIAGKWFLRRFADGLVRRVPSAQDIERISVEVPGTQAIDVVPRVGDRLSDLPGQDSYSYELASVFIGADDQQQLEQRYQQVVDALPFEFDE